MALLRARDDRDRPVTLRVVPPVRRPQLRLGVPTWGGMRRAALRALRVLLRPRVLVALAGTILALELIGLTIAQGPTGLYVAMASPVAVVILTLLMLIAAALWTAPSWYARQASDAFLASSRCPSCNYDLSGIAPEEDERVVCAECGAAWASWRIGEQPGNAEPRVVVIPDRPSVVGRADQASA